MLTVAKLRIATFAVWTIAAASAAVAQPIDLADRVVAEGLAEYRRPVAPMLQLPFFGGWLRWTPHWIPLTATDAVTTRGGRAFLTLSRWVGEPVLQVALDTASARRGPLSTAAFGDIVSRAAGQNLDWFWRIAFDPRATIDYAVGPVVQRDDNVEVTVLRRGVPFTGSSRVPLGSYGAGEAIVVETTFADGGHVVDRWDGRQPLKTFAYISHAPAVRVDIDPDRVIVLDTNRTNNTWTLTPRAGTAARRWAARWTVWLEQLVTGYAFFV